MIQAELLMLDTFPFLDRSRVQNILNLCEQNAGLSFSPLDKPTYLFAFFRFWPELAEAVEEQNFDVLFEADLTEGPLVYIAAMIAPSDGYRLTWNIFKTLNPQPYGYCCHRWRARTKTFDFRIRVNSRREARRPIQ